ncbi:hypothetical protein FC40_GL001231 [Ligilactobacillus hayakitensis DSM 18933 = JCM 14209]|uniref:Gram-positive cocci surface proteins LPxTG domain-containing protein n=1 Tax=Ligilactobacillus hayakitensis DSM 18933 = JCM 14209 TaxID=1423755 RepID=A0A0R1X0N7_9LACO|nr:hypothetical protein [Ligilactobacillus hayakitensis]KRM19980.1 hypothetical protein FC40_GL001231 [Ligilactobacillus hayakitensis DSM 18933 = JCM 14209]
MVKNKLFFLAKLGLTLTLMLSLSTTVFADSPKKQGATVSTIVGEKQNKKDVSRENKEHPKTTADTASETSIVKTPQTYVTKTINDDEKKESSKQVTVEVKSKEKKYITAKIPGKIDTKNGINTPAHRVSTPIFEGNPFNSWSFSMGIIALALAAGVLGAIFIRKGEK